MIQILGGMGGGGDNDTLNKELAAQSDGGSLFSVPFGDKTIFHTNKGGKVMLMFTFDPDKPYNSSYQMASISGDYSTALRRALTKQLLNEDPKKPSLQESVFSHLKSVLSATSFNEMLKQDTKRFHEYTALIAAEAKIDFDEEKNLTEAMINRDFNFRFEVAIDAYPAKLTGTRQSRDLPPSRKGVLTFYIQSDSKGTTLVGDDGDYKAPEPALTESKESKDTDMASSSSSSSANSIAAVTEATNNKKRSSSSSPPRETTTKKRRTRESSPSRSKRGTDSQQQWKKLQKRLHLDSDTQWNTPPTYLKKFDTAYDFFEAADKWFLACIRAQSERLQADKRSSATSHLYN